MQAIPDLMACMLELDDDAVRYVRKTAEDPPRVSILDVIGIITGLTSGNSRNMLWRLSESHPEVTTICSNFKFPGRGQRETPVTDAEGIVRLIMLLPGRAAAHARQMAAKVLVRYLGGDASLVQEVMANHHMQVELDPEHPASMFGQSVQRGPTPYEIEMAKSARMQALGAAFQLAKDIGSNSQPRLRAVAQTMIDELLLPPGDKMGEYVCAADILRERGHDEYQISRLVGELGKDLKTMAESEERSFQSAEHEYGSDRKTVGMYHRVRDAAFIEDVLMSFKERALYAHVVGEQSSDAQRRQEFLASNGRGRKRTR